jgi:cytochrome P450 family 6
VLYFYLGFETSSSTASFVLYLLSIHEDIQEKLRNEIKNVLTKHNGEISYEAMQEMKYLQMVIDGNSKTFKLQMHCIQINLHQKHFECTDPSHSYSEKHRGITKCLIPI